MIQYRPTIKTHKAPFFLDLWCTNVVTNLAVSLRLEIFVVHASVCEIAKSEAICGGILIKPSFHSYALKSKAIAADIVAI